MRLPSRSTALVLALIALAAGPMAPELAFSPEPGIELDERFEYRRKLELVDQGMRVTMDGEELDQEPPEVEMTLEVVEEYGFVTEYLEVEDGQVTRLRRTLDRLVSTSSETATSVGGEGHGAQGGEESTREGESELLDVPIVFVWDEDAEIYEPRFGEDAELDDESLLEGLEGGDVLSVFLGSGDAESGDTWDVDLDAFRRISSPGGDLKVVKEGDDEDKAQFEIDFHENLEGEIEAEHRGTRDEDGTEVTVIALVLSLETEVSRSGELEAEGIGGTIEETFGFSFELTGELLWDAQAGHAHAFELDGDMELSLESHRDLSGGAHGDIQVFVTQEFEGECQFRARVE